MSQKTRSEKYRDLRDTISLDKETELSKQTLRTFEDRLNRIDPHLMDTISDGTYRNPELEKMNDTLRLRPFGNHSSIPELKSQAERDSYTGDTPVIGIKNPVVTYDDILKDDKLKEDSTARPKTKEELSDEIRNLFREVSTGSLPQQKKPAHSGQTDDLLYETQELKTQILEYENELQGMDHKMEKTRKMIHIILWAIIAVLSVILLIIIVLIIRKFMTGS